MKKQMLVLLLPVVIMCACKTAKKLAGDNPVYGELINDESFRKPINDKDLFKSTTEIVPLDTVYLTSDTLNIVTKKVTGCDADNFKLIWNGDLGKSIPAKTSVKLLQYVEGDCRERHRFHLIYNISKLTLKTDTSAVKSTLIYIGGWHKMVNYSHN